MSVSKGKNILFINGVFEGHVSGVVEIIKDLVSLGHNVTCYVIDNFEEKLKKTGAKLKKYSIDISDIKLPPQAPKMAINVFKMIKAYDAILSDALKLKEQYDYLIVDRFFDGVEINKIFKAKTVITTFTCVFDTNKFPNVDLFIKQRIAFFEPINKKYNLKIRDFLNLAYIADAPYKLVLTSKLFNPDNYSLTDNSFIFIGPSIEKRAIDDSFKFKKDENKKLIYISLGTVFNKNIEFYQKCIKAFENKKEFQVMMSIGKSLDVKELGDLPDNFFVYNYVPQIQVLDYTDIFITHGGTNSIYEALLLKNLPLIVIPQNGDQFTCAKQIEKNGAGVTLDSKNLTSEILISTVNNFLEFKEKYKNGVNKLVESFKEARKERKKVYEKLFI